MNDLYPMLVAQLRETFAFPKPLFEFGYSPAGKEERPGSPLVNLQDIENALGQSDRHGDLARLPYRDGVAGTVVCRGALECAFEPPRAVGELLRILRPSGLLVVVAAGPGGSACPAGQFWHFTPAAMERLLAELPAAVVGWLGPDELPRVVFGVGCKAPLSQAMVEGSARLAQRVESADDRTSTGHGWLGRLWWRVAGRCGRRRTLGRGEPIRLLLHMPFDSTLREAMLAGGSAPSQIGSRLDLSR